MEEKAMAMHVDWLPGARAAVLGMLVGVYDSYSAEGLGGADFTARQGAGAMGEYYYPVRAGRSAVRPVTLFMLRSFYEEAFKKNEMGGCVTRSGVIRRDVDRL
jgi:hypothetical protein